MASPEITLFSVVGPTSKQKLEHFVEHYRRHGVTHFRFTFHFDEQVSREMVDELESTAQELLVDFETAPRAPWTEEVNKVHLDAMRAKVPGWHLLADLDEYAVPPIPFVDMAIECERYGLKYVRGMLLDRVGEGGALAQWPDTYEHLDETFPNGGFFTSEVLLGCPQKVVLARSDLDIAMGNHNPERLDERGPRHSLIIPVHHFKWDADVHLRLQYRFAAGAVRRDSPPTREETQRLIKHLIDSGEIIDLNVCDFDRVSLRFQPDDWQAWASTASLRWEKDFKKAHPEEALSVAPESVLQGQTSERLTARRSGRGQAFRTVVFDNFENAETARAFASMARNCTRPSDALQGRPFPALLHSDPAIEGVLRGWLTDPHSRLVAALDGDKLVGFAHAHPDEPSAEVTEEWRGASSEFPYSFSDPLRPQGYEGQWHSWSPEYLRFVRRSTIGHFDASMRRAERSGPMPMLGVRNEFASDVRIDLLKPTIVVVDYDGMVYRASPVRQADAPDSSTLYVPRGLAFSDTGNVARFAPQSLVKPLTTTPSVGLGFLAGLSQASGKPTPVAVDAHMISDERAVNRMVVLRRNPKREGRGEGLCAIDTYISAEALRPDDVKRSLMESAIAAMSDLGYDAPQKKLTISPTALNDTTLFRPLE